MATCALTIPAPRHAERVPTAPSSPMPAVSRISRQPAPSSSPSARVQGPSPPFSLPLPLTSSRRGHDFPDPLVKVYDLRNMRPLPPIPFSDGPAFINLLPKHTSSLVVTSAQGLVNVVDVSNTNASEFYHVRILFFLSPSSFNPSSSSTPPPTSHPPPFHPMDRTWPLVTQLVQFISSQQQTNPPSPSSTVSKANQSNGQTCPNHSLK